MEEPTKEVAVTENQDVAAPEPTEAHAKNAADVNMANLRAAKDKAERERAEMAAKLEELQRKDVQPEPQKEEKPEYGDEDFVEGKHLRKELDAIRRQQQEFEIKQTEASEATLLRKNYSDFSKVMTDANADKLKELDPESFQTIANSTASYYQRSVAAYKRIKELGIVVEDNHEKDRAHAHANAAKPRPMNSVSPQQGDSPLSMANAFSNGLTDELKRQLYKEMQDASKKH